MIALIDSFHSPILTTTHNDMLATSLNASWKSRRRVVLTCCLVAVFSTLLWGLEVDKDWVRANLGTVPSFSTTGWRDRLLGGSAARIKPVSSERVRQM